MVSRSCGRARRMLTSWHALTLLFFCIIGCASAAPGLRIGSVSKSSIGSSLGRELQKEEEKNQKDKEKEKEVQEETEAPTEPFSIIEFQLASFTLLIDGSLSEDGETEIREELQQYLLDYFLDKQEEKFGIDTDSIVLSMTQIVESYVANTGVRRLQSDSSTSISTLLEYEASANLRFKEDENEDVIVDLFTDVLEIYVKALEDRTNLQGHFLDLFASELEDPVIFTQVQVGERPPVPFKSEEALEEIQSILDPSTSIIDTKDESDGANSNASVSGGNSNSAPKWRVAVYVCFALLGLIIGLCAIMFFRRKEKKVRNEKPDTLSIEYRVHDQATDNVDVSEENNNYDKIMSITEANTVSTGKDVSYHSGKSTGSRKNEGDDSEVPPPPNTENNPPTTEERSSKKKSFMSFLPFKGNKQGDESIDQDDDLTLDSFGVRLKSFNNVSYNDDDSMMGYSLTSMNRVNQEAQQDESLLQDESTLVDGETLSYASSVSDTAYNDQVFAGVQKILKEKRRTDKENYENSTLGGESLSRMDTFETEDGEDASAYEDDESNNADDQSVASAVRSVVSALSAAASKYFGEDELMMTEKARSSAPSEEFRSPSSILRTDSVESDPDIPIIPNNIPMISSARNDRDTPVIQNIGPDPDIPMIPDTEEFQSPSSILRTESVESDPDIPIIPNNPDIPVIANTRNDRDTPVIQNIGPDPDIPMIPNTRNDRDTPIIQNTRPNPPIIQNKYVFDDVASDAPSDERMGPSPVKRPDATPHPEAMRNSRLIDNDPAVLNYLVQGPDSTRNESMESEDQDPTVEL